MTRLCFLKEVEKRGLKVAVAGIPKTIDNDIAVSIEQDFVETRLQVQGLRA